MFGFLPEWVGDTLSLLALVTGLPAILLWFLNRKDANRKLKVEEGGLTVSQFNAALPAYQDMLNRADAERKEAVRLSLEYKEELNEVREKQDRLIQLITALVARTGIVLTAAEIEELEATRPRPFRRRSKPSTGSTSI